MIKSFFKVSSKLQLFYNVLKILDANASVPLLNYLNKIKYEIDFSIVLTTNFIFSMLKVSLIEYEFE